MFWNLKKEAEKSKEEESLTGNKIIDEILLNRDFEFSLDFSKLKKDGDFKSAIKIRVLR